MTNLADNLISVDPGEPFTSGALVGSSHFPDVLFDPPPPPGHFNLLYFAAASSHTCKVYEPLPAGTCLGDLGALLERKYPGFESLLQICQLTVNLEFVDPVSQADLVLREEDEVAILPPVSAG